MKYSLASVKLTCILSLYIGWISGGFTALYLAQENNRVGIILAVFIPGVIVGLWAPKLAREPRKKKLVMQKGKM